MSGNVKDLIEKFGGAGKFKKPAKGDPMPSAMLAELKSCDELRETGFASSDFKAADEAAGRALKAAIAYLELAAKDPKSKEAESARKSAIPLCEAVEKLLPSNKWMRLQATVHAMGAAMNLGVILNQKS